MAFPRTLGRGTCYWRNWCFFAGRYGSLQYSAVGNTALPGWWCGNWRCLGSLSVLWTPPFCKYAQMEVLPQMRKTASTEVKI